MDRLLLEVPCYTFDAWPTKRTEDAATLWQDYSGRETIESPLHLFTQAP